MYWFSHSTHVITPVVSSTIKQLELSWEWKLTAEQMLLILLNIEDYSSSDLDLREKVEVPEDKKGFTILFKSFPLCLLECEKIIVILSGRGLLLVAGLEVEAGQELVVGLETSITQVKNVVVDLDDEQRKVNFSNLSVAVSQFVVVCGLLSLRGLIH